MRQYNKYILIASAATILFSGCSYKEIEVYQKNDTKLSCEKLSTHIADIIDENDKINETTGLKEKSVLAWIFWPPFGAYNETKAALAKNKLDERFEHLIRLKYKNNCKISLVEKKYMLEKGRLFDN